MNEKHILVISQYFFPEEFRINDICKEWVKKGYQVTVVTGIPNYPEGKFYKGFGFFKNRKEIYEGINVIRIPIIPRGKNTLTLILNYISFVVSGYIWQLFTKMKADYVFIFEVSPMTQALPGVWYSDKMGIPCYIYVQDLWPENVEIIMGVKNKKMINIIGRMVDYIYDKTDKIFVTSNSFAKSIISRGVPKNKVEFWAQYAEDYYVPLKNQNVLDIPNDDFFNVIFAGNIGDAQGLEVLPKTAKLMFEFGIKKIRFNIVGDGRNKKKLIDEVNRNEVSELFNFIDKQPSIRIPELLAVCDAAFVSFVDNPIFRWTIPAKLQSYLACGIPIIASAAGETASIIKEAEAGYSSSPGNEIELAENLIKLMHLSQKERDQLGRNARIYYDNNFDKDLLLNKIDIYFEN